MAYKRRYMRPFVGTSIVIQDDAITGDKISDKAVKEKHLADGVVSERTIGDEAVDTGAIKDGEVKTADIGDEQVTEEKLADGAVTEDKLSFIPSTRPLTPPIATVEIADDAVDKDKIGPLAVETAGIKDGAVTAAKLAGDAVETIKIKDEAVTGPKIPTNAIDNGHIQADAVRGTEIQDNAVSAGKIGADAAITVKVKDKNITKPKLEDDILHLLLKDRQLFYDDFLGATLRSEWAASGDPGGSSLRDSSRVLIKTSAVNDEIYRLNFNDIYPTSQGDNPKVFCRCFPQATLVHARLGLYFDANNYMLFDFDTDVDGNWHAKIKEVGAESDFSTGVVATNTMKSFLIDHTQPNEVKFYIDGALTNTLINLVPLVRLQPLLEIQTRTPAARTLTVDKFILSADDSVGPPPP